MPRQARKKSQSGIYHIMFRGINRQQIFEEAEDNYKFLSILYNFKAICEYELFAYCLMGNHVHLLMRFNGEPIEQVMKRICSKFVYWYNTKYNRIGHLFQDRFKSEPIEDDGYFISCVRYIHQNPVKAGIGSLEEYPYSSYTEYAGISEQYFVDTQFLLSMIDREQFIELCNEPCENKFIDILAKNTLKMTDEQARNMIYQISKCSSVAEFQALDLKLKPKYLSLFKEKGLGIRQISRLTGENYYIVQKT